MSANQTKTARGTAPLAGPVCFVVVNGPDEGKRFELEAGTAIIGTQADCGFRLTDPTVSRQHTKLAVTDKGLLITDLGSRNGTWVNGLPVTETRVVLGARLRVGESELQVLALQGPLSQEEAAADETAGLVGTSRVMRVLRAALWRAAPGDTTVLIQGETGTGKDVLARALHAASGRSGPLVTVDCASLSPELIASELFGHVAGAFSGASHDREGAVQQAAGGTLFLDEVGELALSHQPSLLRLLETKSVRPVGGATTRRVDVRIVAATHRDLSRAVRGGTFREDLFHRLSGLTFVLPPLRERIEDIPVLSERILAELGLPTRLDADTLEELGHHKWPGNVRELRNTLQRLVLLGQAPGAGMVEPTHSRLASDSDTLSLQYVEAREAMHQRFERAYLINLLRQNDENVSKAARTAGIARSYLYRMLKRHDLV